MHKTDPSLLWSLNYRLLAGVIASVGDDIAALGLEVKQLFVLAAIDDYPHPAALAERLVIPKPSVTAYVKQLEAAGFIKREIDPDDLRRHRLTITPSGRKVAAKGLAVFSEAFGARLARLTAKQQAEFASLLELLNEP